MSDPKLNQPAKSLLNSCPTKDMLIVTLSIYWLFPCATFWGNFKCCNDNKNGKQQISKCWRKIIANIFLYSPKFCTYRLSMKMEYTVSCVSDFLKLSSLVPLLRKHLKDVLHQTEGVNQETERYGLRESRVEYHLGSQETQNRLFRKTER